jgi:hypothetical protein
VFKHREVSKCRLNQKDGTWTLARHRGMQKPRRFRFFLCKSGRERVLCILAIDALENAAQQSDLSEPALNRIFDAHRLLIELRAAQKVNAGLLDPNGSVLLGADDI